MQFDIWKDVQDHFRKNIMTNNDRENFHEGTRQNEKERDSNMISHNIQKYQRQKARSEMCVKEKQKEQHKKSQSQIR